MFGLRTGIAALALVGLAAATSASAAVITFSATGVATGSGPSGSFANTPFTVTATADTATKTQCSNAGVPIANCFFLINSDLSFTSPDFGSFSLLNPSLSIRNAPGGFAFAEVFSLAPFGLRTLVAVNISAPNPQLAGYDLVSDLGPITVNGLAQRTDVVPGPFGVQRPIPTTGGNIILTQTTFFSSTFQAALSPAAVPEPSSWALMIVGFGLAGAGIRRVNAAKVSYA